MKKLRCLLPLVLLPILLCAQKTVTTDRQTWLGFYSQARLSERWGLWLDAHYRLKGDFLDEPSLAIFRPGLTYYLYDDLRLTAGYAFVNIFPAEGHEEVSQPEHRPWQQVQWFSKFPKLRIMNWVRMEERFRRKILNASTLDEGYNFNWRARYNIAAFIPLTKKQFGKGGLQLLVNDEAHIAFGKNVVYNHFDQNRFFVGLVWQITDHSQLHGGYTNVFQQLASGNQFKNIHAIRIFYFHNFDWRKSPDQQ